MDVVRNIENLETGKDDKPIKEVVIAKSGVIDVTEPFNVDRNQDEE